MNNPLAFHQLNKRLGKQSSNAVTDIQQTEFYDMRQKFFALDHTAEVLENYRRIHENQLFDKVLHDERLKKAFLKHEGRKQENLIADYGSNFSNYKYLENTSEQTDNNGAHSALQFMQDNFIYKHL